MVDSKLHEHDEARWPLSFQMSPTGHKFWSHQLYRGPQDQPVRVIYSRTKMESEELAREFVNEKVLGFDMEWPWKADNNPDAALQQRIGLIQIACQDKIALFHIGLHIGHTPNDLLAPSLRRIIQSPDISKCGVAVLDADFSRLRKWFALEPRGAFELSHLHNLVTHGATDPSKCTTKLRNLAKQVEEHLGLPLHKGQVRRSNWSNPLSQEQIKYAAADAYAGYMLYHNMNARRVSMQPSPPLPVHAETYWPMGAELRSKTSPQLRLVDDKGVVIFALEFFQRRQDVVVTRPGHSPSEEVDPLEGEEGGGSEARDEKLQETGHRPLPSFSNEAPEFVRVGRRGRHVMFARAEDVGSDLVEKLRAQHATEHGEEQERTGLPGPGPVPIKARRDDPRKETISALVPLEVDTAEPKFRSGLLDEDRAEALFQRLRAHRSDLARERKCAPFIIAHDTLLRAISRQCPRSNNELFRIKGIGKKKAADFGKAWLAITSEFVDESGGDKSPTIVWDDRLPGTNSQSASRPQTPTLNVGRVRSAMSPDSVQMQPLLHIGLSLSIGRTGLAGGTGDVVEDKSLARDDEDLGSDGADSPEESSAFGTEWRSPYPSALALNKRKREETEDSTNVARPGLPRDPPQPILDAECKSAEQSLLGQGTVTTDIFPSLPSIQGPRISPTGPWPWHLWSGPPARSRAYRAVQAEPTPTPQLQDLPTAALLRAVPLLTAQELAKNAGAQSVGATQRPVMQSTNTREMRIFRNKIVAFNKLVTATIKLSPDMIDNIVLDPPRTIEKLLRVPGILPFANACSRANRDFLAFVVKSAPKQGLGQVEG